MKIKLIAKTKKGKDRIAAFGDTGIVLACVGAVNFSFKRGPWLNIEMAGGHCRWVLMDNRDTDFNVEVLEG